MAHNRETQATSEDMPKVPYAFPVKGWYKFKKRYPTHLLKAGIAPSEFRQKALGTKDRNRPLPFSALSKREQRNLILS